MLTNIEKAAAIRQAWGYIDTEDKWCQGVYFTDGKICAASALLKAITSKTGAAGYTINQQIMVNADFGSVVAAFGSHNGSDSALCELNNTLTHKELGAKFEEVASKLEKE